MTSAGTIIVPLDRSEKDGRALAVALALAELSGAALDVVHVTDSRMAPAAEPAEQESPDDVEAWLAGVASHTAHDGHGTATWHVLTGHDVVAELLRYAVTRDALMVVMGTRAPNAAERVLAGSVADRVMRECPRPVVLVPPGTAYMAGKQLHLGRVLTPLDGSALAEQALEFMLGLRNGRALEYVLFNVTATTGQAGGVAEAEGWLEGVASRARANGATVETWAVDDGAPAEMIVGAVREYLVEMIAMSTRGSGGVRRFVLGSVAESVVRASEVPVLLLTPATLAPR